MWIDTTWTERLVYEWTSQVYWNVQEGGRWTWKPYSRSSLSVLHFKNYLMVSIVILNYRIFQTANISSKFSTTNWKSYPRVKESGKSGCFDPTRMFFLTRMVGNSVLRKLRMRRLNTKRAVPLDVVPERRTKRCSPRFRPGGRFWSQVSDTCRQAVRERNVGP